MTYDYSAGELSQILAENIEMVCDGLGVTGARQGNDLVGLNPTRADKKRGSFRVCIRGAKRGLWSEFSDGSKGDALALVNYIISGGTQSNDWKPSIEWALDFLNIRESQTPEQKYQLKQRAKENRIKADSEAKLEQAEKARMASAIWLNAKPLEDGDIVTQYLEERGIRLPIAGFMPGVLRCDNIYLLDTEGYCDAMIAGIYNYDGKIIACHRTYIENTGYGVKKISSEIGEAKKVLGSPNGGFIPIWKGVQNGRQGSPLSKIKKAELFLCEGIEDALTIATIIPSARIWAVISLGNFARIRIPPNVTTVTICGDNDESEQAQRAFKTGVENIAGQVEIVKIARSQKGKDFNDWLISNDK